MYNTRRGGGGGGYGGSPASNVGQRRPLQGNFVPGGQLRPNMQQGPPQQHAKPPQNQPPPAQKQQEPPKVNLQKSAETAINQQKAQEAKIVFKAEAPMANSTPVRPEPPKTAPPKAVPAVTPAKIAPVIAVPKPMVELAVTKIEEDSECMDVSQDETPVKGKANWMHKKTKGIKKITKAEKVRRRNIRLRKILQPKNALMVLNEIAGATSYDLTEVASNPLYCGPMVANFKATVTVDGRIHEGFGKNKPAAKTAAAEAALKHLVLTRITSNDITPPPMPVPVPGPEEKFVDMADSNGDEKMEEDKEDDIPYCHLASFALYKLFSSWDDGAKILSRSNSHTNLNTSDTPKTVVKTEMRPSKKMPDSPEQMNPVMLLNQMCPNAIYDEVCKSGIPPKIVFTMKCTIDGKAFIGNGQNKKIARREAAYQACKEMLGVKYVEDQV